MVKIKLPNFCGKVKAEMTQATKNHSVQFKKFFFVNHHIKKTYNGQAYTVIVTMLNKRNNF